MIAETSVAQTMLAHIADSICERPGDTKAQRSDRYREVVHTVRAFRPRDPVEMMMAGVAVTHVHLIHDAARDALLCRKETLKARTKSTIVALDRGMLRFLKELRDAQKRTLEAEARPEPVAEPETKVAEAEPPVPSPVRRAETSVAAMMAVVSPPNRVFPARSDRVSPPMEFAYSPLNTGLRFSRNALTASR
jgi:hypothetical protein